MKPPKKSAHLSKLFLILIFTFFSNASYTQDNLPKVGIAMSGTGAHAFVNLGVIKALEESNIPISYIAAQSTGTLIGALYASGNSFESITEIIHSSNLEDNPTYKIERIITEYLEGRFPEPQDFDYLPIPFRASSLDLTSGQNVILSRGKISRAVEDCMASPGFFPIRQTEDRLPVDARFTYGVPVEIVRYLGADIVIAADLISFASSEELSINRTLDFSYSELLSNESYYLMQLNALQQNNIRDRRNIPDILIRPDLLDYPLTDYSKIEELVELGYKTTVEILPTIANYFPADTASDQAKSFKSIPHADLDNRVITGIECLGNTFISDSIIIKDFNMDPPEKFELKKLLKNMDGLIDKDYYKYCSMEFLLDGDENVQVILLIQEALDRLPFTKDVIKRLGNNLDANALNDKVIASAFVLEKLSSGAAENYQTEKIDELKLLNNKLKKLEKKYPTLLSYGKAINQNIEFLELTARINLIRNFISWFKENPKSSLTIVIYLLFPLTWFLLYWIKPLALLEINNMLLPLSDFTLPKIFGGMKAPVRYVLLLQPFLYRNRVLDAWISIHIAAAEKEFRKKSTVDDRRIYVPIPVNFDNVTVPGMNPQLLKPSFKKNRTRVLIWGEGGIGKTSLVCQIALWAMEEDPSERIMEKHKMLPVLIEEDLNVNETNEKTILTDTIRGELGALIGLKDPISNELFIRLLRSKRILVVIDGFSEMSSQTQKAVQLLDPEFPVNALLITSRQEEKLQGIPKANILPLRIIGNKLSSFMESYLTRLNKRHLFDDIEFFDACKQLSLMVGNSEITVLLAKLFVQQLIVAKEKNIKSDIPDNIPDLMLGYINELNREAKQDDPDDREVQHAVKVLSWECLKNNFQPTSVNRRVALDALTKEGSKEILLDYLEKNLRIIQTIGPAKDKIVFSLDPLAEYLACFHIIEVFKDSTELWSVFLSDKKFKNKETEKIKGFCIALYNCIIAKNKEYNLPSFVRTELDKKVVAVNAMSQHP